LHPVLHLLATRPQWLAEHAGAYGDLAAAELGDAAARSRRAVLLAAVTLSALAVSVTLAGVALMLWAVTPTLPADRAWLLLVTPALPLAVALVSVAVQRLGRRAELFPILRQQLQADLALLREAGAR
jgi:hypothetical protein